MVTRLGLAPYFLTVAEIVRTIREKGIQAACRGSAAGSVIAYALRISDVDLVAHDLVWQRFMNPYRDEIPDIDIDIESARREDVYRDLLDRYGEHRVACVAMVETFKARMAIREVGKALGLPAGEVDHVAKSFPHVRAGDVRAALAHLPEMRGLNLDRGQLGLLFDVVERMDGFPATSRCTRRGCCSATRTCATSSRWSAAPPASRWPSSTRTTSRRWGCASSTCCRCGCCRRSRTAGRRSSASAASRSAGTRSAGTTSPPTS